MEYAQTRWLNLKKTILISIISLLFLGYGCTKAKSDMDGLWVSAYQIQTAPNEGIADYKKIMRIVGDTIFFRTTGEPKNGLAPLYIKSKFKRTLDGIETEDENFDKIYIHELASDSVVISYKTQNSTKEVFKKLIQPKSRINWNPSNKSYEFKGNSGKVNITFFENGLFVDYLQEKEDVSIGHWYIIEEKNNSFIVLDDLNIIALSVDSLLNDKVYLSVHDETMFDYTLVEQNLEIPNSLLGAWAFVSADTLRTEHQILPSGYKWPTVDFLRICKDSINTIKNNVESTKKWTIGGINNLIVFPEIPLKKDTIAFDTLTQKERIVLRNIWKIDSLSENELVLLTEYELVGFNGFEIKLIYQKEKN